MADGCSPVGVLGGTFDPIHNAHLRLAEEARAVAGLAEVRLVPAGVPPHRHPPQASSADRLAMARLATEGLSGLSVDASEAAMTSPSYTVLTLRRLRESFGVARPLVLILGADAFLGLATWFRWQEVFELAHLLVATRPGHELNAARMGDDLAAEFLARRADARGLHAAPAGSVATFAMTPLDISATAVRAAFAAGTVPRACLPIAVLDYISSHSLYLKA